MEVNSFESVYTMMTLRRMILELRDIAPIKNNMFHINCLVNAVVSNNINMINNEVARIEETYQPHSFSVHPLEYLQKLKSFNDRCIDIIRSMGYYFTGDQHALDDITKLLLITDKDKLARAAILVYGEEIIPMTG
jgi:hypothetical protein